MLILLPSMKWITSPRECLFSIVNSLELSKNKIACHPVVCISYENVPVRKPCSPSFTSKFYIEACVSKRPKINHGCTAAKYFSRLAKSIGLWSNLHTPLSSPMMPIRNCPINRTRTNGRIPFSAHSVRFVWRMHSPILVRREQHE